MEGATVTESGRVGAEPEAKRIDIISDTHGHLSPALLEQLEGADLIIHAGDITSEGLRFAVAHYREDLPVDDVDVAVCGHTHRSRVLEMGGCLVVNPGSATFPRGSRGATMARMMVSAGEVLSLKIIDLE